MPDNQKVCIFVDGENLRHSIVNLFPTQFRNADYLPRANWTNFFDWISREAVDSDARRVRTYWYVVQNIDFAPFNLHSKRSDMHFLERLFLKDPEKARILSTLASGSDKDRALRQMTEDALRRQESMQRRFNGWANVHDTIAHKYTAIEFRKAGAIRYDLLQGRLGSEKAVDVKLATDLIRLKDIYDIAVIVSGDQDYVPAVDAIKDFGKHVVNVAFKTDGGGVLPGGARRLNQSTDRSIELEYSDLKRYLGFSANLA